MRGNFESDFPYENHQHDGIKESQETGVLLHKCSISFKSGQKSASKITPIIARLNQAA